MKVNLIRSSIFFLLGLILFVFIFIIFDLAKYDSSYLNRSSLTFSVNNLNSKKTIKIFNYLGNFYNEFSLKFSKNVKEKWAVESQLKREDLPKNKIIEAKKNNFIEGKKITEIEKNFSNWTRSHGGFSSSRFSSLKQININNVKDLKLAWVYNSKDGKKGIQANPIVYEGLIYTPTPGNNIVCLDGKTGEEVWKYKVVKGYNVAKRGLLIWYDKKK